jgi:anti-anti-sigma regulatory factor
LRPIVSFVEHLSLLRCSGDEDRATQGCRRQALSRALRAPSDVVVDLSELSFADVSLMLDLATLAGRLRRRDRSLLLRDAPPHILRLIELVGVDRLPGVRIAAGAAPVLT